MNLHWIHISCTCRRVSETSFVWLNHINERNIITTYNVTCFYSLKLWESVFTLILWVLMIFYLVIYWKFM